MKRSQRMSKLVELEQVDEKSAVSQLGLSRAHLEQQQVALKALLEYRKEYADQLSVQGQTGVEATRLNDYAKFITQLDDAIELQKHQLADAERAVIDKQKIWQGHYQRVESLSKVVQQNLNQENSIDRKKVERQLDDRAGTLSGNTVKPG
ncbi:MAG: flagellar export protein FliJ [Gammaproteobacteria bacterium]|jgi:flagellar protein FliJ|nr:flagellar export protein FliJ [Gammaproteobacteria bacterium]MBT5201864.1 flagellar export protein FliJ [Gammaproteobacteria bacterium]MBT5601570.1 flagellar export protein FliJ [Gammaproteobacteria bacterium]MBT6247491.1 flagellar export protein FliJ [Gammaproteobacteria bacterium]